MAPRTIAPRPDTAAHSARGTGGGGLSWRWLVLGALLILVGAAVLTPSLLPQRGEDAARTAGRAGGAEGAIATLKTNDFHALAFSPTEPNVVFFGHHNGVMQSDDGGRTWRPLVQRLDFDAMALAVSRANPRQMYLVGHDVFQVSTDAGASWQPLLHNLPGTDIHGFAMSPDDPNRLFAYVVDHGFFGSADGGKQWQQLNADLPEDVAALAASSSERLFAGSVRNGVGTSSDGGRSWAASSKGLASLQVLALAVDPTDRQSLYAAAVDGLYRSDDAGATWRKLPFPGKSAVAVAVSPGTPKALLAIEAVSQGEGRVYRSEDGGATWGDRR